MDSNRGKSKRRSSSQSRSREVPPTPSPHIYSYTQYPNQFQQNFSQYPNQFQQYQTQFPQYPNQFQQCYVPDTSHFRNQVESSDETIPPSDNEEEQEDEQVEEQEDAQEDEQEDEQVEEQHADDQEDAEEVVPETQPSTRKRNYTHRVKRRNWEEREEIALAKAYISCSEDQERGNTQRSDSFWQNVLEHFQAQIQGTDRTKHQINSKYKDMLNKVNKFNCIYNNKMNMRASGRGDADVLQATHSEYRKLYRSSFSHTGAWEILKEHAKWETVKEMGMHSPHHSAKRSKTSGSNQFTNSPSDAHFSPQPIDLDEASPQPSSHSRQRKGKNVAGSSSMPDGYQTIVDKISALANINEAEAQKKETLRAKKMAVLEKQEEELTRKSALLEQEIEALKRSREQKDLKFFLKSHDHLTGSKLALVLGKKQEIAEMYGWEL